MSESYIVCEGYHDRAFWGGLLLYLGCSDPGLRPDGRRVPVLDPWGLAVRGSGEHAYLAKSGHFIRVVPAGGKTLVLEVAARRLRSREQKAVQNLIVSVDADQNADGTPNPTRTISAQAMMTMALDVDSHSARETGGAIVLTGGTHVHTVQWMTPEGMTVGLPNQHSLERLISAAIAAAYPARPAPVQQWLNSRPDPPAVSPKEHAWSYMAGWYADCGGYEGLCTRLWSDPAIVRELIVRLTHAGVWRIAELLAHS